MDIDGDGDGVRRRVHAVDVAQQQRRVRELEAPPGQLPPPPVRVALERVPGPVEARDDLDQRPRRGAERRRRRRRGVQRRRGPLLAERLEGRARLCAGDPRRRAVVGAGALRDVRGAGQRGLQRAPGVVVERRRHVARARLERERRQLGAAGLGVRGQAAGLERVLARRLAVRRLAPLPPLAVAVAEAQRRRDRVRARAEIARALGRRAARGQGPPVAPRRAGVGHGLGAQARVEGLEEGVVLGRDGLDAVAQIRPRLEVDGLERRRRRAAVAPDRRRYLGGGAAQVQRAKNQVEGLALLEFPRGVDGAHRVVRR